MTSYAKNANQARWRCCKIGLRPATSTPGTQQRVICMKKLFKIESSKTKPKIVLDENEVITESSEPGVKLQPAELQLRKQAEAAGGQPCTTLGLKGLHTR